MARALTPAAPRQPGVADTYEPTRRFWQTRGFFPLVELEIRDTNAALFHVPVLKVPASAKAPAHRTSAATPYLASIRVLED